MAADLTHCVSHRGLVLAQTPKGKRHHEKHRRSHRCEKEPEHRRGRLQQQVRKSSLQVDATDASSVCDRYFCVAFFAPSRSHAVFDYPVRRRDIDRTKAHNCHSVAKVSATLVVRVSEDTRLVCLEQKRAGVDRGGDRPSHDSGLDLTRALSLYKTESI